MPTVLAPNVTLDVLGELAGQFVIIDQHPDFGVQVCRPRVKIECSDKDDLVVNLDTFRMDCEIGIFFGEPRIFLYFVVLNRRARF